MKGDALCCPISLEPLPPGKGTFVHDGVSFGTLALHSYLVACPGSTNPLTRAAFSADDVNVLNAAALSLSPDGEVESATGGRRAARAKRRRDEAMQTMQYFEGEARDAVVSVAEGSDAYTYDAAMATAARTLCDICVDVFAAGGGEAAWEDICRGLVELAQARMPAGQRLWHVLSLVGSIRFMVVLPGLRRSARVAQASVIERRQVAADEIEDDDGEDDVSDSSWSEQSSDETSTESWCGEEED